MRTEQVSHETDHRVETRAARQSVEPCATRSIPSAPPLPP
jgi:hypothetical protein